ncbi:MAG: carboxypeptidase-like regulatory domain-containing protein [Candidatus Bathyarchaeia archaeon]|jgi:hypothetical protein
MKHVRLFLISSLIVVSILATNGIVLARPQPFQYYGGDGGEISGYVFSAGKQPFDWAAIYARSTQRTFQAFSGMSGFYEMRLPSGTYSVTVNVPGYEALVTNATVTQGSATNLNFYLNSMNVTVSEGSSSVINFYLQQTQTPVPEFQPAMTLLVLIIALTSTVIFRRLKK